MRDSPDSGSVDAYWKRRLQSVRWIGWLEVAIGPLLFAGVTWYHLYDDSGMAAVMWLWSMPIAVVVYMVPGVLLVMAPRWGLLAQALPALFTGYLLLLAAVAFR